MEVACSKRKVREIKIKKLSAKKRVFPWKNAVALRANAGALFVNTSMLPTNACTLKELTIGDFESWLLIVGLMNLALQLANEGASNAKLAYISAFSEIIFSFQS